MDGKRRRTYGVRLFTATFQVLFQFKPEVTMSHHFDTPTAKEDPRINVNDFYLFEGAPGTTVMAMTVNPDAGLSAPETFRAEGLYAFRFDLDGDAREDVTFKFRFGEVRHAEGDEHRHVQSYQVLRATGEDAKLGAGGEVVVEGESGKTLNHQGVSAYAGLAPDLFAGNAAGLHGFMTAFYKEQNYAPEAFANHQNFFANRNVSAMVLQVPNALIGTRTVRAWATVSLVGHAPEVQVSRWGLPMVTHIFLSDPTQPDLKENFNRSVPADDGVHFTDSIAEFTRKMATYAGLTADPAAYAREIAGRLSPTTLPYEIGTPAEFTRSRFNGRALTDDAMDVMLSLATNAEVSDGVAPDASRIMPKFPYFGQPFTSDEQKDVKPATAKK